MESVKLEGNEIEEVETFTYLGSIIDKLGGTDADVKARLGEHLYNSGAPKCCHYTKRCACNSNMKSVLLCRAQTRRTPNTIIKKVQTFINNSPRRVLHIRWPTTIHNSDLLEKSYHRNAGDEIRRRRCWWLGHILRKPASTITRQVLTWNPSGKRTPKKYAEKGSPDRHKEDKLQLEEA